MQVIQRTIPILSDDALDPYLFAVAVRNELRKQFRNGASKVTESNYLEFGDHRRSIVAHLGVIARQRGLDADGRVHPETFTVTLVDAHRRLIADCQGNGPLHLYILNEGNGHHFVPLFQT